MQPKPTVQIQAGIALAAAIAGIVLCGRPGALGTVVASGLGMVASVGLAVRYHRLVRGRERSAYRAAGDRAMTGCVAFGLGVPSGLGIVVLAGALPSWSTPLHGVPAHVAAIAAVAVFAAMLTSSCFDWYLIRPFRDGVLGPPVCQMHEYDNESVLYYARAWVAHRVVAEIVGWGGSAIVLIVGLVALQQSTHDPTWSGIFTYLAPSGAVYLGIGGYLARRLRPVPQYVQRASPGLGRWARGKASDEKGNERDIDGFVVDVALGVGLQTLGEGDRNRRDVSLRDAWKLDPTIRSLCRESCEHWIPHCERGLLEHEAQARAAVDASAGNQESPLPQAVPSPATDGTVAAE